MGTPCKKEVPTGSCARRSCNGRSSRPLHREVARTQTLRITQLGCDSQLCYFTVPTFKLTSSDTRNITVPELGLCNGVL